PYAAVKARADRGSPMFTDPASQSITRLNPASCYEYIYPAGRFQLDRISYYFDHEMEQTAGHAVYEELFAEVHRWQESWRGNWRPYLRYRKSWSTIRIEDGRGETPIAAFYSDQAAALYEFCADARTAKEVSAMGFDLALLDEFVSRD